MFRWFFLLVYWLYVIITEIRRTAHSNMAEVPSYRSSSALQLPSSAGNEVASSEKFARELFPPFDDEVAMTARCRCDDFHPFDGHPVIPHSPNALMP